MTSYVRSVAVDGHVVYSGPYTEAEAKKFVAQLNSIRPMESHQIVGSRKEAAKLMAGQRLFESDLPKLRWAFIAIASFVISLALFIALVTLIVQ